MDFITSLGDHTIKVSVIVPFYNPGRFFLTCISSIVTQTYENLEIILVDDGSTENKFLTHQLINDKRVKLFNLPHRGVSYARNFGLSQSTGEYIIFLDSDDFFEEKFIEKLLESAIKNNSDVVIGGFCFYNQKTQSDEKCFLPKDVSYVPANCKKLKPDIFNFSPNVWNKMFKRTLITDNRITFQKLVTCNDFVFTYLCLACAEQISIVNIPLVHYRVQQGNNISSSRGDHALNICHAIKLLRSELSTRNLLKKYCYTFKVRAFRSLVHEFLACSFSQKCRFIFLAPKILTLRELMQILCIGLYDTLRLKERRNTF